MSKSTIVIVVCVTAILIVVGVFYAMSTQNNSGVDHGDLTILDSDKNIVQGLTLTYTISDSNGKGNADSKTVVTEVTGDNVRFTNTYNGRWNNETGIELSSFSKSEFYFDYTDSSEIPEGITVKKDGDSYIINGEFTEKFEPDYTKYTCKDLTITLDSTEAVKSVSGQITDEYTYTIDEENYEKYTDAYTYRTKNSTLYADWEFEGSAHYDTTKDRFFEESVIYEFSPDDYEGATITESSEKLGDYVVKVYTVNGEVHTGMSTEKYEDYKVYVYGKYIISVSGKIDGDNWRSDILIKIEN
jgi:hypothetical protein